jgi:hypothetical protein
MPTEHDLSFTQGREAFFDVSCLLVECFQSGKDVSLIGQRWYGNLEVAECRGAE